MSFARFENMTACKTEMTELGHTDKDADNICMEIKDRAEKGILYKATPTGLTVLSKANDSDLVIGGYASWELVDPERDIITTQAQSKGLQRFLKQPREYQSITVNHKEFKLAQPMLKYVDTEGHQYFSHVNEKGTYLISKLRNDNLKTTQVFREKARNGDFTHYSISGSPLESQIVKAEDGLDARRVDDIEYWAVTLCEKGVVQAVNPKAMVSLINKSEVIQKTVEKRGNQWCVVHCHGEQAGEAIKCFDTKEEADAMHAAIQANKATSDATPGIEYDVVKITVVPNQIVTVTREKEVSKAEIELILQKHGFNKCKE